MRTYLSSPAIELNTEPLDFAHINRHPLTQPITISPPCSAAFDIHLAINPLVAIAAPILLAITHLQQQPQHLDTANLFQVLSQEIKIFEDKARKLEYRSPIILATRYLLCAFIDEILTTTHAHMPKPWQHNLLLKSFQGESWGGERFFIILERASDDPQIHVELLELGFLCLSLGYKGRYAKENAHLMELAHIKDNLLTLIHKIRGNPSPKLFIKTIRAMRLPTKITKKAHHSLLHLTIAAGLFIFCSTAIYLTYSTHLTRLIAKQTLGVNLGGSYNKGGVNVPDRTDTFVKSTVAPAVQNNPISQAS